MTLQRFEKKVRVWSSRHNRGIDIHVDYGKASAGDFTLFHIARLRDDTGHDSVEPPQSPRPGIELR